MEGLQHQAAWSLDDDDAFQGLTSRQYKLATLVFQGLNDTEAYRQAGYGGNMNPQSLGKAAHLAVNNPKVQAKLRELRQQVDAQTTLAPSLSREWILNGIMDLAANAKKENVRLAAYVNLGKVAGIDLFRETTRVERVNRTPEDLDRELQERLADMAKTIEGKANRPAGTADDDEPTGPDPTDAPRDRRRKPRG